MKSLNSHLKPKYYTLSNGYVVYEGDILKSNLTDPSHRWEFGFVDNKPWVTGINTSSKGLCVYEAKWFRRENEEFDELNE